MVAPSLSMKPVPRKTAHLAAALVAAVAATVAVVAVVVAVAAAGTKPV